MFRSIAWCLTKILDDFFLIPFLLQIDISCMGQNLLRTQTLKQVRDAVWLPRLLESVDFTMSFEDSYDGSTQHLMSLHYSRPCELDCDFSVYSFVWQ